MRVVVDATRCSCFGECVMAAPEIFALVSGEATVRVLEATPPERLWPAVREAADNCPTEAIGIAEA